MLKRLYFVHFLVLIGKYCADVNITSNIPIEITNFTNDEYDDSNSTTTEYFNITTEPPEYPKGCSSHNTSCSVCEVCVDDHCLPYVVGSIYDKNCSLVDHCAKGAECGLGTCTPSYGEYVCDCPHNTYGFNCGFRWKDGKPVPVSDVRTVYSAMVAALSPVHIMLTWRASGDKEVQVEYSVYDQEFSDYRLFNRFYIRQLIDPREECTANKNPFYVQFCDVIFPKDKNADRNHNHNMLKFSTKFPYLDQHQVGSEIINKVNITLPGSKSIMGYLLKFSLILTEMSSNFTSKSEHEIFVYYKSIETYTAKCFPSKIETRSPCVSYLPAHSNKTLLAEVTKRVVIDLRAEINKTDCSERYQFEYHMWDERKILRKSDELEYKVPSQSFPPFSLNIGKYRVEAFATFNYNETQRNFALCHFEVKQMPLIAKIEGGDSRTVYMYNDLLMDASSSEDPNSPTTRQQSLFFTWSCDQHDKFCKPYKTKTRQYVIKAPLRPGVTFQFTLLVSAYSMIPAYDHQNVTTTDIKFASFRIMCKKNCETVRYGSNPKKMIYLIANITDKYEMIGEQFTWTCRNHTSGQLVPIDGKMRLPKTAQHIFIVNARALEPDEKYTFTASRKNPTGSASYIVKTSPLPQGVTCSATTPSKHKEHMTRVLVTCRSSSNEALTYTLYAEDHMLGILPIFLNQSDDGLRVQIKTLFTMLKVKVSSESGSYVTIKLPLQVRHYKLWNENTLSKMIRYEQKKIHLGQQSFWGGLFGGYLNMIVQFSRYRHQHRLQPVFNWVWVLGIITKEKCETQYEFMRFLSALSKIVQLNGIPTIGSGQDIVLYSMSQVVARLSAMYFTRYVDIFKLDQKITNEESRGIARSLFECLSHIISSSTLSDEFESRNEIDTNLDLSDLELRRRIKHRRRSTKTPRVHHMYESQTKMNNHNHIKFSDYNQHKKKVNSDLLNMVNHLAHSVASGLNSFMKGLGIRILPMETPVTFGDKIFLVNVVVDDPVYFSLFPKIPIKSVKSYIAVSKSLSSELHKRTSYYLSIMIIIVDRNPYWWDEGEIGIVTQLIVPSFIMAQEAVSTTHTPLDIFLWIKHRTNSSIAGSASLLLDDVDALDKDMSVTVFRVMPPLYGGGGKLFVKFVELNQSDSLRVVLSQDERPDYETVIKMGKLVSKEHPELSLHYELTMDNTFLFIGILPGPLVGNRTDQYLVHCQCPVFSHIVGAGMVAPPVDFTPIMYFQYFRDREFNLVPTYCTLIFLLLCTLLLVWAFLKDKTNVIKRHVVVLEDNFPGEEWAYLLGVYTGISCSSGTSSKVALKLIGEESESRPHVLRDSKRKTLQTYADDWFLLCTQEDIGKVKQIHIWLDYSGNNPSWYCRKIVVFDCRRKAKYVFRVGMWFLVDTSDDDDVVETFLSPEPPGKQPFWPLMVDNLVYNFQESHFVFSIFKHHPRSLLTEMETMAVFLTSVAFVAFLMLLYFHDYGGGPEDLAYFDLLTRDIVAASLGYIPTCIVTWALSLLFKQKIKTKHMSTWRLVTQKIKDIEKSVVDNAIDKLTTALDETPLEAREKGKTATKEKKYKMINTGTFKKGKTNPVTRLPVTILNESADQVKIVKFRIFLAWFIVLITFAGFCIAIVVRGLSTGVLKSYVWITISIVSLVFGLLMSNTIRVLLQTIFMTVIKKKQQDEPLFACDPKLGTRMDLVGDKSYLDKLLVHRSRPEYYPLKPEQIQDKKGAHKKKQIWFSLLNWSAVLLVYILVFLGTVISWSHNDYHISQHMVNFIKYGKVEVKHSKRTPASNLADVDTNEKIMSYFENTLSYMFNTLVWYNEKPLSFEGDMSKDTGWVIDYTNRLVGVIRLRIKKGKIESCVPPILQKLMQSVKCVKALTATNEDKGNYSVGWQPVADSYSDKTLIHWKYQYSAKFQALIKYGPSGRFYSSGGYFLNLARNSHETNLIFRRVKEASWFSKAAEVIIIDISMYSPNTNKISLVSVCLELRRTQGVDQRFRVIHLPANTTFPTWDVLLLLFIVIILISLLTGLYIAISESGTAYFYSFWNILDVCIVPLFALNYIFSLKFKINLKFNIEHDLRSGQDKFFYFGWLEYYTHFYYLLFTVLFVLCSIRPLKYCKHTLQVLPIIKTIRSAWYLIVKVMLFFLPFFYIKFSVIDSFLFNPTLATNRFPLVTKLGLKNYAKMYIFPERKLVPYLYCQLCSVVIGLLSVFIAHHYRITKNSAFLTYNTTDLLVELMEWFHRGKRITKLRASIKNKVLPTSERLRSGADCFNKFRTSGVDLSPLPIQNTIKSLEDEDKYVKHTNYKVYLTDDNGTRKREMNKILRNIETKLDQIVASLMSINNGEL